MELNDPADSVFHPGQLLHRVAMLYKNQGDGHRSYGRHCQIPKLGIHLKTILQHKQKQNAGDHCHDTDYRHSPGIRKKPLKLRPPKKIGILFSLQPAQVTPD